MSFLQFAEGDAAKGEETGQGAVIVQIDVTDRKRAEQSTQIAREAAAHAARVNAVGVLATSLVHELAQPLNAAAFFGRAALEQLHGADATQRPTDAAMLEPMIAKADAQLERAGAIVERLRDFLRHKRSLLARVFQNCAFSTGRANGCISSAKAWRSSCCCAGAISQHSDKTSRWPRR